MKLLPLVKDEKSIDNYLSLVNPWIEKVGRLQQGNNQKILEILHIGKFLLFFDNQISISSLSEKPDFILEKGNETIGLEHQMIVDNRSKKKEGAFENLFKLAEEELKSKKSIPNILANIYVNPNFKIETKNKNETVTQIIKIIEIFVKSNELIANEIIRNIRIMKHSQINLISNLGAWWQKELTSKILNNAIEKKEFRIEEYKKNVKNKPVWLLLVVGGVGASSYEVNINLKLDKEPKFERVYILEEFSTRLYQLK
jgi:hypothetical protein